MDLSYTLHITDPLNVACLVLELVNIRTVPNIVHTKCLNSPNRNLHQLVCFALNYDSVDNILGTHSLFCL